MEQHIILSKDNFPDFVMHMLRIKKVVGPVKKGKKNFVFSEINSPEEIALKYIPTIVPPKKYFLPHKEKIVEFNKRDNIWDATLYCEELIIFGVHTCDLAGMQSLNIAFSEKPEDFNYNLRKNKTLIIGLECNDYCDEYASCAVMDNHNPNGGYDLFFTDLGDRFYIHVNTMLGEELIEKIGLFTKATAGDKQNLKLLREKKRKIFKDEVKINHNGLKPLFDRSFDSIIWEELGKKCVSCGSCTKVCPTCYCYDVEDEMNMDLNTGSRSRIWDSCQNASFAMVAGGENFREERSARQRHRFMRKFKYLYTKYRRYFCTGCGRCSRTCMAKINLKDTINSLAKEKKG